MKALQDKASFEHLFREHYAELCRITYPILHDRDAAEDVVQSVFIKLWENKNKLEIKTTLKGYLYKAVVYSSLDFMKKQNRSASLEVVRTEPEAEESAAQNLEGEELKAIVKKAIGQLPDKCRAVFTLSRYNDMKNREIAEFLDISIKTVENQMTKALKMLRDMLKEHSDLVGIICVLIYFFNQHQ